MKVERKQALTLLKSGKPVAIPTETVYGLGAPIDNQESLEQVFHIKKRPLFDPLIVHIASIEMAMPLLKEESPLFKKLAEAFWPGPFTIVSPKSNEVSDLITAGLSSVGIRLPRHEQTIELIKELGIPLAAPSANLFKKTSPTTAEHVLDEFDSKIPVLDGGPCEVGIESTVVGLVDGQIHLYRPGAILKKDIEKVADCEVLEKSNPVAPGQMEDHYQPSVPLKITNNPSSDMNELILSKNALLAARELYGELRRLSKKGKPLFISPQKYPNDGIWGSIWERIEKASTK